jgi:hypothetical protein
MIVFYSDDELAEIWIDGKSMLDMCKDTHDLETAKEVALFIANGLKVAIDFKILEEKY